MKASTTALALLLAAGWVGGAYAQSRETPSQERREDRRQERLQEPGAATATTPSVVVPMQSGGPNGSAGDAKQDNPNVSESLGGQGG